MTTTNKNFYEWAGELDTQELSDYELIRLAVSLERNAHLTEIIGEGQNYSRNRAFKTMKVYPTPSPDDDNDWIIYIFSETGRFKKVITKEEYEKKFMIAGGTL
ncbi:MAG TPA: hypothetical protein ACFYEK_11035 [Candidatus Wunengus sp. YC60]|uniref:hypothetical protein n=1 Tax=Candidatus Wunengus sp. YC60 TaxID=3367697 RepID=UPI004027EC75